MPCVSHTHILHMNTILQGNDINSRRVAIPCIRRLLLPHVHVEKRHTHFFRKLLSVQSLCKPGATTQYSVCRERPNFCFYHFLLSLFSLSLPNQRRKKKELLDWLSELKKSNWMCVCNAFFLTAFLTRKTRGFSTVLSQPWRCLKSFDDKVARSFL